MKFSTYGLSAALLLAGLGFGCASGHQEGVTSDYHAQWTNVAADVETTTMAAKQVFTEDKLNDISVDGPTKIDGEVSATTADKTKIYASIKKGEKDEAGSVVSIQVGKLGDPKIGANYAAKIKQIAEKKSGTTMPGM